MYENCRRGYLDKLLYKIFEPHCYWTNMLSLVFDAASEILPVRWIGMWAVELSIFHHRREKLFCDGIQKIRNYNEMMRIGILFFSVFCTNFFRISLFIKRILFVWKRSRWNHVFLVITSSHNIFLCIHFHFELISPTSSGGEQQIDLGLLFIFEA